MGSSGNPGEGGWTACVPHTIRPCLLFVFRRSSLLQRGSPSLWIARPAMPSDSAPTPRDSSWPSSPAAGRYGLHLQRALMLPSFPASCRGEARPLREGFLAGWRWVFESSSCRGVDVSYKSDVTIFL